MARARQGGGWQQVPIGTKMFTNIDESALTRANASIENAFINEAEGHSRFFGLDVFADFGTPYLVYGLHDWRGDLIATTSGGTAHRIDSSGKVGDIPGTIIDGGRRHSFAETDDFLLVAAGGTICKYDGFRITPLADNAPQASHLGYIDGYVMAVEPDSGRFWHCEPGAPTQWLDTDVFTADSMPDDIGAMLVTPFRELIFSGQKSLEQYERLSSGDVPFFRRWALGEGISAPGTLIFADSSTWGLTMDQEFVRFSGQLSQVVSGDIGLTLRGIDDWTDAWAAECAPFGQNFIILSMPNASLPRYGTKGITLAYDVRGKRWCSLLGWNALASAPGRWPGWSVYDCWSDTFVGGAGKVYRMSRDRYRIGSDPQRMSARTADITDWGVVRIDDMRARLRRGTGTYTTAAEFRIRARRDSGSFGPWVRRSLGNAGENATVLHFGGFGMAESWQFEYEVTDEAPIELVRLEVLVTQLDR
ncbi:MAG: hypothetical protein IPK75_18965 [Acidobacteria bacterium]|nr:hypothetical protein [Acidobacteriota bacterium]